MKRLALLVLAAYAALALLLAGPWVLACFADARDLADYLALRGDPGEFFGIYREGFTWIVLGVFLLCQAALLVTPVRLEAGRPVGRRSVWWVIIVTGLLAGVLAAGLAWSLIEAFRIEGPDGSHEWLTAALGLCSWLLWAAVFGRLSAGDEPRAAVLRLCRRLLQGGALAFLVAVPCHIVARHRNMCCAGFLTFIGLTCGLAVMLLAFGPGVYFLFAERLRRLRPRPRT